MNRRVAELRQTMQGRKIEAFMSMRPENRRYLSGFTGTAGTLLITADKALLFTDFRYVEQAVSQAPQFEVILAGIDPFQAIAEQGLSISRLGFEGDFLTYADFGKLRQALPQVEPVSCSELIDDLRAVKDPGEIELIRQAVRIADQSFNSILQSLQIGQTEEEIAVEMEFQMRRAGASGRSFDFIVASGWRSALPHGVASTKKVQAGEFLTLDFGAVYQGYCSDITRTLFLGEPDERQREIYDLVLAANRAGIETVRPGRTGKEVDAVVRRLIEAAGYGQNFGHGLGHSVGLAIHEGPNLNTREERVLEPGMTVTVEPGVYIPGWGGVRIEDLVVVTESGCEVLTRSPKELIAIK